MESAGLDELLGNIETRLLIGDLKRPVQGLAYDSRLVRPGFLFFAIPGVHTDGHHFLLNALDAGAVALVVSREPEQGVLDKAARLGSSLIQVAQPRKALAEASRRWYGEPEKALRIIGVTGTDGKSSTVWYSQQILEFLGYQSGFISTVAMQTEDESQPNDLRQSTPESPEIFSLLRTMANANKSEAVLESTSHGLSERTARLHGIKFQTGIFTNISHEHLEFHGSFENYLHDKANLFRMLRSGHASLESAPFPPAAVINAASEQAWYLASAAAEAELEGPPGECIRPRLYFYAIKDDVPERNLGLPLSLWAENIELGLNSVSFDACFNTYSPPEAAASPSRKAVRKSPSQPQNSESGDLLNSDLRRGQREQMRIKLDIPGRFTVENAMAAALGVHAHSGRDLREVLGSLSRLRGVKGRMQNINCGQAFAVLVDYAHTPGSFAVLLPALRKSCQGRLILVFGSGGERDREKRPIQGRIAAEYADLLILANEDPRLEDPVKLLEEIAAGVQNAQTEVKIIPDRTMAIREAFSIAAAGDLVALLGKGHEQSIILSEGKIPWDEETVAREELARIGFRAQA